MELLAIALALLAALLAGACRQAPFFTMFRVEEEPVAGWWEG
jgi:hypothetical protein